MMYNVYFIHYMETWKHTVSTSQTFLALKDKQEIGKIMNFIYFIYWVIHSKENIKTICNIIVLKWQS